MKRVIALLLAIILIFSFSACGGETEKTDEEKTTKSQETQEDNASEQLKISSEEFKYYYYMIWSNYYNYAFQYQLYLGAGAGVQMLGFDYTKSPADQAYADSFASITGVTVAELQKLGADEPTWADAFTYAAFNNAYQIKYCVQQAQSQGITLTDAQKTEINSNIEKLKELAENEGCTLDEYLSSNYGKGVNEEVIRQILNENHLATVYLEKLEKELKDSITDDEIDAEYEANKSMYSSYSVRHILIAFPTDEYGQTLEIKDEEKVTYKAKAQAILDEYLKNPTEENFARLATERSEDPGSAEDGGLYEGLTEETNFVQEFKDWYLDESRKVGDTGIIETDYGYHVMYYSKGGKDREAIVNAIFEKKYDETFNTMFDTILEKCMGMINVKDETIAKAVAEQNELIMSLVEKSK